MKKIFIFIIFLLPFCNTFPQSIEILPSLFYFEKSYADALSHQFSISDDFDSRDWFANIGALIPLANIGYNQHSVQISAGTTIYNTIRKTPGHIQVFTVDYLVDFFFDYKLSQNTVVRFLFGHLSAHYSDDGIVELGKWPLSYVRDYIGFQGQYRFEEAKIYALWQYNFNIEPAVEKANTFQIGGDKFINLYPMLDIYGAVDFKFKEETDFTPIQSYQAGIKLFRDDNAAIRLAYTFRNGFEERGQLYYLRASKHTLGVFLDF